MAKTLNLGHIIFRALLGLCIIGVALKSYFEIDAIYGYVFQNFKTYSDIFKIGALKNLGKYSEFIALINAALLAYIGMFEIYGFSLAKRAAVFLAIFDIVLIYNPILYAEPNYISMSMLNFGLLGAVLCN